MMGGRRRLTLIESACRGDAPFGFLQFAEYPVLGNLNEGRVDLASTTHDQGLQNPAFGSISITS